MCERSARQNIQQGIISVDADREQSSWTADSWNIGNVLLYNHRDTMMMTSSSRLRNSTNDQWRLSRLLPGAKGQPNSRMVLVLADVAVAAIPLFRR